MIPIRPKKPLRVIMQLYVAPFGKRTWNGLMPDISTGGKRGPLPSIPQASDILHLHLGYLRMGQCHPMGPD